MLLNCNEKLPSRKQGIIGNVFYKLYVHDYNLPILITFGSMGMIASSENAADQNYSPWGFDFAIKLGLNVLSFTSYQKSTWYRCPVFHDWLEENRDILSAFPERLGYGGSMGGYAASAFSKVLRIDRLLLLNPISTLNKKLVPWESRPFENSAILNDWSGKYSDGAITNSAGWVVYDSIYNLDSQHAKRYPNLRKIYVPGVGHQIPKHLNYFGLLKPLLISFIKNKFDPTSFYSSLRKRRHYIHYYKWLESGQNTHRTAKRLKTIEKYKNSLLRSGAVGNEITSSLVDEILSLSLSVEDYDLDVSLALESIASKIDADGLDILVKKDVEMLKELALKFEKSDLQIALRFMKLALIFRPNGPFLAKKVKEYNTRINNLN